MPYCPECHETATHTPGCPDDGRQDLVVGPLSGAQEHTIEPAPRRTFVMRVVRAQQVEPVVERLYGTMHRTADGSFRWRLTLRDDAGMVEVVGRVGDSLRTVAEGLTKTMMLTRSTTTPPRAA